jgi:hypothetical protein
MKLTKNRFIIPYKKATDRRRRNTAFTCILLIILELQPFFYVISTNNFLFLPSGDLQRQLSDDPITVQLGILIGIFSTPIF